MTARRVLAVIDPRRWWRQWLGGDIENKQAYEANLRWRRKNMRGLQVVCLFASAGVPLLAAVWFLDPDREAPIGLVGLAVYFQLFFLVSFLVCRAQAKNLEAEQRTLLFETAVQEGGENQDGLANAAKTLFLKNEVELKRYYDQALRQSSLVFLIGVLCVLLGISVVVGASVVVLRSDSETAQIVIGVLGVSGGLLSGFVARVYLGLHRGTVNSMTDFHNRFVVTHHLLFSNVLVAHINDPVRQDEALHAVASGIASNGTWQQPHDRRQSERSHATDRAR